MDSVPLGDTSRAARPTYAIAVANSGRPATHSPPNVTALSEILTRTQDVLRAVVQATPAQSAAHGAPATLAALSARAEPILRELMAVHAGLAAAQALQGAPLSVDQAPVPPPSRCPLDKSSAPHANPAWSQGRCIVLDPPDDAARRRTTDISVMGAALSTALRTAFPSVPERSVEMLRRTAKGGYCAQLSTTLPPPLLQQARALTSLSIAGMRWTVSPLRQTPPASTSRSADQRPRTVRRDSFILGPVPDSLPEAAILKTFIRDNAIKLQLSPTALKARLTGIERLQRRLSRGPQAGSWVPSRSVRIQGDPALVASVVRAGTAVLDFHPVEVRPFEFPPQHCFHCGREGHVARHCRGRCHRCDRVHPTVPCPGAPTPPAQTACPPAHSAPENRRSTRTRPQSRGQHPGASVPPVHAGTSGNPGRSGDSGTRQSGVLAQW